MSCSTWVPTAAGRVSARLATTAAIVALAGGMAMAATPSDHGHTVGTLDRIDTKEHRLVLGTDAAEGDSLGQGAPIDIYYDGTTTISGSSAKAATDLKVGDRLLVKTTEAGNRISAKSVQWLPDTTPGQGWGRYVHGTISEMVDRTQVFMVAQAGTNIRYRIGHDQGTKVLALDGSPMTFAQLKTGDDVDIAYRLVNNVRTATKVVVVSSTGGR